jgi:hypothetical protein
LPWGKRFLPPFLCEAHVYIYAIKFARLYAPCYTDVSDGKGGRLGLIVNLAPGGPARGEEEVEGGHSSKGGQDSWRGALACQI